MMPWKSCVAITAAALLMLAAVPFAHAQDVQFTINIKNHKFDPAEIEAPAGKRIKLLVKNLDDTAEEFESLDLHREKIVAAGSEITVYVGPLSPGKYEFFGDFHQDTARGHITVK